MPQNTSSIANNIPPTQQEVLCSTFATPLHTITLPPLTKPTANPKLAKSPATSKPAKKAVLDTPKFLTDPKLISYVNKETGKSEKMDITTGEIFTSEQFYSLPTLKRYNLEDAYYVCAKLRSGLSLASIANLQDMPSIETLYSWKKHHPDFALAMKEAREYSAEIYAYKALTTSEGITAEDGTILAYNKDEVAAAKMKADAYRWMAEKLDPETFGNRTKISGDADQPLTIIVDTGIRRGQPTS